MDARRSVLVLGANGMLGHKFLLVFQRRGLRVVGTVRTEATRRRLCDLVPAGRVVAGVDVLDMGTVRQVLQSEGPFDFVVNCTACNGSGLSPAASGERAAVDPQSISHRVNARFPHELAAVLATAPFAPARLIHVSSDGVFSGRGAGSRGTALNMFSESHPPDSDNAYGQSKAGAVGGAGLPHPRMSGPPARSRFTPVVPCRAFPSY